VKPRKKVTEEGEKTTNRHGRLYDACVNGVLDYGVLVVAASLHTIFVLDVLSFTSTLNLEEQ